MPHRKRAYNFSVMTQPILRIATRKSPLALWQASHIQQRLLKHWPTLHIEFLPLVTSGDRFLKDKSSMNKGLFVKELEEALLERRADVAVHSMKDVPATFPEGLILKAICKRHNPWDAFLSTRYNHFNQLPEDAVIGTSSLRRQSQLLAMRPHLHIVPLRGNIQTRISKMSDFDAIVLAVAGLERMGLLNLIKTTFDETEMLPACGQGALGIECRADDEFVQSLLVPLNDQLTTLCINTERQVNALLGGNCHVPLAVFCKPLGATDLHLLAKVATPDGQQVMSDSQQGPLHEAHTMAVRCAQALLNLGASDLLGSIAS